MRNFMIDSVELMGNSTGLFTDLPETAVRLLEARHNKTPG